MAAHNIEPAYTPTYSSWLNAIEAHFTSLKKFAIGGTRCEPRVRALAYGPLHDLAEQGEGQLQGCPGSILTG